MEEVYRRDRCGVLGRKSGILQSTECVCGDMRYVWSPRSHCQAVPHSPTHPYA